MTDVVRTANNVLSEFSGITKCYLSKTEFRSISETKPSMRSECIKEREMDGRTIERWRRPYTWDVITHDWFNQTNGRTLSTRIEEVINSMQCNIFGAHASVPRPPANM